MANFFKWMFGIAAKERKWTEAPRMLPSQFSSKPAGEILLSKEFQKVKKKYLRQYCMSVKDGAYWDMYLVEVNMKKDSDDRVEFRWLDRNNQVNMLYYINRYQNKNLNDKNLATLENQDSDDTYHAYALAQGYRIDGSFVRKIEASDTKVHGFLLKGDAVKKVFNQKTEDNPYKTWDDVNKLMQDSFTAEALEAVLADPGFEKHCAGVTAFLKKIENLEVYLKEEWRRVYDRTRTIEGMANTYDRFLPEDPYARDAMLALIHVSTFKAVLDATAAYYVDAINTGKLMEAASLQVIEAGGNAAVELIKLFDPNLSDKAAQQVKNIIMTGEDPVKQPLPLRTFLETHYQGFEKAYDRHAVFGSGKSRDTDAPGFR